MNQDNPDKITLEDYKEAVKSVLLAKRKSKSENRMPTKEELEKKWKLVRK